MDPNSLVDATLGPAPATPNQLAEATVSQAPPPTEGQQKLAHATDYYRQNAEKFFGRGTESYISERIPGVSAVDAVKHYRKLYGSVKKIEAGTAEDEDYYTAAQHLAKQEYESQRSTAGQTLDAITHAPGMLAEWAATGGAAGGAKIAAEKALGGMASRFLGRAAIAGAGVAGRTLAMPSTYGKIAERTIGQGPQGELQTVNPLAAAGQGLASSAIENAVFTASGHLGLPENSTYVKSVLKGLGAMEANGDLQRLAQLSPKGGALWNYVAAQTPEEKAAALQEFVSNAGAVLAMESGLHAVQHLGGHVDMDKLGQTVAEHIADPAKQALRGEPDATTPPAETPAPTPQPSAAPATPPGAVDRQGIQGQAPEAPEDVSGLKPAGPWAPKQPAEPPQPVPGAEGNADQPVEPEARQPGNQVAGQPAVPPAAGPASSKPGFLTPIPDTIGRTPQPDLDAAFAEDTSKEPTPGPKPPAEDLLAEAMGPTAAERKASAPPAAPVPPAPPAPPEPEPAKGTKLDKMRAKQKTYAEIERGYREKLEARGEQRAPEMEDHRAEMQRQLEEELDDRGLTEAQKHIVRERLGLNAEGVSKTHEQIGNDPAYLKLTGKAKGYKSPRQTVQAAEKNITDKLGVDSMDQLITRWNRVAGRNELNAKAEGTSEAAIPEAGKGDKRSGGMSGHAGTLPQTWDDWAQEQVLALHDEYKGNQSDESSAEFGERAQAIYDYVARQVERRKPINEAAIRRATQKLTPEADRGTPGAAQEAQEPGTQESILHGPASSAQRRGQGGERVSQFDIIATIRKMFSLPANIEKGGFANADAFYLVKPEAAVINKMYAGDSPLWMHEAAHHIAKDAALPLDPATLPAQVRDGLKQFDYQPNRAMGKVAMQEGFAEWLRMRESGQLQGLTPEQTAAATWAEQALPKDVLGKLDRVKKMFDQFGQQSASEQFGGLISQTGEKALAQATPGEKTAEFLARTRDKAVDNLLDDLAPIKRAEKEVASRGLAFAPGTKPSEVMATTRFRNAPDANEMEKGGVFAYDKATGRKSKLSMSLEEATKGATAKEMEPGGDLDRLMHARQADYMHSQGKGYLNANDLDLARATLAEFARDPAKMQRLTRIADNVSRIFDATLDAGVMAGRFTKEYVDKLKAMNPFYVSTARVLDPEGWKSGPRGRKGEEPIGAGFIKARSGSGEQIMPVMDALRERLGWTAAMVNKQAKDYALFQMSKQEGIGPWMNPGVEVAQGGPPEPVGWPKDGTKPSYTMMIDGKPIRARINDRSFYEAITGTQGEDAQRLLAGLTAVSKPVAWIVRQGATILSPAWHIRNFFRDPIMYTQRTISGKNTIQDLADLGQWYGKAMKFYATNLVNPEAAQQYGNTYFRLYEQMAGREQRMFGGKTGMLDGWWGLYQRLGDLVTSGEVGTRVLEMKNKLDQMGYTKDYIDKQMALNPQDRNPIPFAGQVAALNAASQITHNVHQMGTVIRELNKSIPFLGAHIAGTYKDISNFRSNTKKALYGVGILAMAKATEFLLNKDDEDWKGLPTWSRTGFNYNTPLGWAHFPAPRGLNGTITGAMDTVLRATHEGNPKFAEMLQQSLEEIGPHGGPEPFNTAAHLLANRSWTGRPIVPIHQADKMTTGQRLRDTRSLGYAASQLTGGMADTHRLNPNPFSLGIKKKE